MRLYKKLEKGKVLPQNNLVVPRVISIYQKCVEHGIQDTLIKHLHFNDLCLLNYTIDIARIKQALKTKQKQNEQKSGVSVTDISQTDAVKFLKGGV